VADAASGCVTQPSLVLCLAPRSLPDLVNASRVNASQAGLQPLLQGVRTALHDSSAVDAFDFRECLERPSLSPATYRYGGKPVIVPPEG
jgi:hypothetical protein